MGFDADAAWSRHRRRDGLLVEWLDVCWVLRFQLPTVPLVASGKFLMASRSLHYGQISQSLSQDCYGDPIRQPGTLLYKIRGMVYAEFCACFSEWGEFLCILLQVHQRHFPLLLTMTFGSQVEDPFSSVNGSWCEAAFRSRTAWYASRYDLLLTVYANISFSESCLYVNH